MLFTNLMLSHSLGSWMLTVEAQVIEMRFVVDEWH
jgi:hypothetical protein